MTGRHANNPARLALGCLLCLSLAITAAEAGIGSPQSGDQSNNPAAIGSVAKNTEPSPFAQSLRNLAEASGRFVVAEGAPEPARASGNVTAAMTWTANPTQNEVAKFAQGYDYEAIFRDKAILFRKRYTSATDLPCVTVAEIAHGFKQADAIVQRFRHPNGTPNDWLKDVFASLSPEQRAVAAVKPGIAVTSLNPVEQQNVRGAIFNSLLETFGVYRGYVTNFLQAAETGGRIEAGRPEIEQPGVSTPVPLLFLNYSMSGSAVRRQLGSEMSLSSLSKPRVIMIEPADPALTRLGIVVEALNRRGNSTEPIYRTADYLRDKPVIAYGEEKVTPEEALRAISNLYGLQVVREKGGRFSLSAPLPGTTQNIAELRAALITAFPSSLIRYLDPPVGGASKADRAADSEARRLRLDTMVVHSVERLTAAMKARQANEGKEKTGIGAAQANGSALVDSLPPEERSWIALTSLHEPLRSVGSLLYLFNQPEGSSPFLDIPRMTLYMTENRDNHQVRFDLSGTGGNGLLSGTFTYREEKKP